MNSHDHKSLFTIKQEIHVYYTPSKTTFEDYRKHKQTKTNIEM